MYPSHQVAARQRQFVRRHAADTDSYAFFNLLTGPQLLDGVEALLPECRGRRGHANGGVSIHSRP